MDARKALVTGASSGIGEATALRLAGEGYSLWLTYGTRQAETHAVAERCREAGAPDVHVSQLDQRDSESISRLMSEMSETWGSLDVLVNNGGVLPYRTIDEITEEEWDFVLQTNARGTFFLTRACLRCFARQRVTERL